MSSPSLPSLSRASLSHEGQSVWPTILSAEQAALRVASRKPARNTRTTSSAFAHHSFGAIPYHQLGQQITSCLSAVDGEGDLETAVQNENLQNLGLQYRNKILRVFRSSSNNLMPIEDSALDTVRDQVANEKTAATTQRGAHQNALVRDGFRCTLTGVYDTYSTQLFPAIDARSRDTNAFLGVAQCAHIFPETAEDGDKNRYEKLMGPDVHEYYNIMTMRVGLRHLFDQLDFWFEEVVEEKNTYDIISHNDVVFRQFAAPPRRVTFRVDPTLVAACNAAGSETPKLPSPALLALRAVCSLIAHMSGAGAHGDQILHDPEETPSSRTEVKG
ncbi:hypothetical protein B0H16DRAFT_1719422 [Mycena metata]|uniref:HNH nuclease domain-containing protein n=1 Tax=Mycena metata TaxID=1033252 RepID=A0AAD7NI61_9AGAR|nr:hypothetical protein B0H16DRAFT_1719422 [Mycena metata]